MQLPWTIFDNRRLGDSDNVQYVLPPLFFSSFLSMYLISLSLGSVVVVLLASTVVPRGCQKGVRTPIFLVCMVRSAWISARLSPPAFGPRLAPIHSGHDTYDRRHHLILELFYARACFDLYEGVVTNWKPSIFPSIITKLTSPMEYYELLRDVCSARFRACGGSRYDTLIALSLSLFSRRIVPIPLSFQLAKGF